jgi:hypothetical protein
MIKKRATPSTGKKSQPFNRKKKASSLPNGQKNKPVLFRRGKSKPLEQPYLQELFRTMLIVELDLS